MTDLSHDLPMLTSDLEAIRWAISLLEIHDGVRVNPNSQEWLAKLRTAESRAAARVETEQSAIDAQRGPYRHDNVA